MTRSATHLSSILVDVELPDPPPVPEALVDLLASVRVVLVGWYAVPEQTSPEQAREQFSDEAQAALDRVAAAFERATAEVETHLVFTGSKIDTISRVANERACDAVYLSGPLERIRQILVPLRGAQNTMSIAAFVADLARDYTANVTLVHVMEGDEQEEEIRERVLGAVAASIMDRGVDENIIRRRVIQSNDPAKAIIDMAGDFDMVVLGETEPSVRDILFGTVPEQVAASAHIPVIVVRHQDSDDG